MGGYCCRMKEECIMRGLDSCTPSGWWVVLIVAVVGVIIIGYVIYRIHNQGGDTKNGRTNNN